jgi:hypothetical protein
MDITGIAQVLESKVRLLSDIPTHLCFDVQKAVRMKKRGTSVHRLKVVT